MKPVNSVSDTDKRLWVEYSHKDIVENFVRYQLYLTTFSTKFGKWDLLRTHSIQTLSKKYCITLSTFNFAHFTGIISNQTSAYRWMHFLCINFAKIFLIRPLDCSRFTCKAYRHNFFFIKTSYQHCHIMSFHLFIDKEKERKIGVHTNIALKTV